MSSAAFTTDGHTNALPPGTRLGEFEIRRVIGVGGFGIVYLAFDHGLEREVAIKEYMPSSLASRTATLHVSLSSPNNEETFKLGLRSFVNEAKLLARFDHRSLIKVHRFWEERGTAYMVMPLLRGRTLREARRVLGPPDEAWLRGVLDPVLGALDVLHREDVYHRDIAPDNILIGDDGVPMLLDFGAARHVIQGRSQSLTAILKPSYAPIEQYGEATNLRQGAWTDLYALGATFHYLLTESPPLPATVRTVSDDAAPLASVPRPGVSEPFLRTIDWMLSPRPQDRPQSVAELREVLSGRLLVPARNVLPPSPTAWAPTEAQLASRPAEPGPTAAPGGGFDGGMGALAMPAAPDGSTTGLPPGRGSGAMPRSAIDLSPLPMPHPAAGGSGGGVTGHGIGTGMGTGMGTGFGTGMAAPLAGGPATGRDAAGPTGWNREPALPPAPTPAPSPALPLLDGDGWSTAGERVLPPKPASPLPSKSMAPLAAGGAAVVAVAALLFWYFQRGDAPAPKPTPAPPAASAVASPAPQASAPAEAANVPAAPSSLPQASAPATEPAAGPVAPPVAGPSVLPPKAAASAAPAPKPSPTPPRATAPTPAPQPAPAPGPTAPRAGNQQQGGNDGALRPLPDAGATASPAPAPRPSQARPPIERPRPTLPPNPEAGSRTESGRTGAERPSDGALPSTPAAGRDPRDQCGGRMLLALHKCLVRECAKPQYYDHGECVQVRAIEERARARINP